MDLYRLPSLIRIGLSIAFFTGITRSVMNFSLMSYRWRTDHTGLWMIYFLTNLTFNSLMALSLLIIQVQSELLSTPLINFEINWLFMLPITSHSVMVASRYRNRGYLDTTAIFILLRIGLMVLLLPIPGNYIWSIGEFHLLFIVFAIYWVISGYYYLLRTQRYLSTHFTDYTKAKAYELFPNGIVVTDAEGEVLSMNPAALDILGVVSSSSVAEVKNALESFDGLFRRGKETYRINRYSMIEFSHRFVVWEIVKVTQLINIQAEIDQNTAAIKSAWDIIGNILNQLKQSIHEEEQIRLQQYLHDVMGETFSVMSYTLQALEGREMDDEERFQLMHMLEQMYLKLEDRPAGGSDNSFRIMQRSFGRIGVEINFYGSYPESYHYRHLTYQILREATNNALKHGGATKVHLMMDNSPEHYHFIISNNGTIVSPPNEQGLGLKGMIRLVNDRNGLITINPDDHYRIEVKLPIA